MIRKLALAVSWRGDDAARVRSLVLVVAAAIVTLVASLAASAAFMSTRVNERAAARVFQPAFETETADLSRGAVYDSFQGEALFIYFWRIETDGVVIPGLPADAPIGTWFVSPELNRRISSAPELGVRFPDAMEIAPDGVGAADELVAYRLVGDEMDLDERLVNEPGREWIVLNAALNGITVGLAGAGLDRRLSLLEALGAPRSALRKLLALTTGLAVVPGAGLAAVLWYLLAPTLEHVPLVGEATLRGDLSLPAWLSVGVAAALVETSAPFGLDDPDLLLHDRDGRGGSPLSSHRLVGCCSQYYLRPYNYYRRAWSSYRPRRVGAMAPYWPEIELERFRSTGRNSRNDLGLGAV